MHPPMPDACTSRGNHTAPEATILHVQIAFGFVDIEIIIPRFSMSREDNAL